MWKAGPGYEKWKRTQSKWPADFKPWLNPESEMAPALDGSDVCSTPEEVEAFAAASPEYADWGHSNLPRVLLNKAKHNKKWW